MQCWLLITNGLVTHNIQPLLVNVRDSIALSLTPMRSATHMNMTDWLKLWFHLTEVSNTNEHDKLT